MQNPSVHPEEIGVAGQPCVAKHHKTRHILQMFLQQKILPGFSKARATLGPASRANSIGSQQMWQAAFSPPEGFPAMPDSAASIKRSQPLGFGWLSKRPAVSSTVKTVGRDNPGSLGEIASSPAIALIHDRRRFAYLLAWQDRVPCLCDHFDRTIDLVPACRPAKGKTHRSGDLRIASPNRSKRPSHLVRRGV